MYPDQMNLIPRRVVRAYRLNHGRSQEVQSKGDPALDEIKRKTVTCLCIHLKMLKIKIK